MRIKFRLGINARALAATIVPAFLLFVILTFNYMSKQRIEAENTFNKKGYLIANSVAALSEFSLLFGDRKSLNVALHALIKDPEIQVIEILNKDRIRFIKVQSDEYLRGTPKLIEFEQEVRSTISDINAFDTMDDVSVNIEEKNTTDTKYLLVGHVKVTMSTHIKKEKQSKILMSGSLFGVLTLLVCVYIGILFARSIVNPIKDIIRAVAKIRKGDYEIRINSKAKNQIGDLGNDIDLLSGELSSYKEQQKEMLLNITHAKEDADRANAKKTNFLALISHDLRNPLNALLLTLEALRETKVSEYQRKLLQTSCLSSKLLHRLIEGILDISVMEAGQFKIDNKYFDIQEIINNVLSCSKDLAEKKGLVLSSSFAIAPELNNIYIYSDPVRMQQILINLINNATKFTDGGGVYIDVAMSKLPGHKVKLCIEVKDTGIGIAENYLSSIFDMFEQVEPAHSKQHEGVGIGLALTKQLTEALAGHIEVESELFKGSLFRVIFDLKYKHHTDIKKVDSEEKLASIINIDKSKKILLVEDNLENQQSLVTIMRNSGLNIDVASNGHEGYQIFANNNYDIVFIDCFMPGMNGYELAKKIRQYEKLNTQVKRTSLVALTAAIQHKDIEKCYASGMDDVIIKPYTIIELYKWIAGVSSAEQKVSQFMQSKESSED